MWNKGDTHFFAYIFCEKRRPVRKEKGLIVHKRYNCIVVFNKEKNAALFCKRQKNPYKGLYNFVGGKVEPGEASDKAAYRELQEETGITRRQIRLYRLMNIRYYYQDFDLELYVGKLDDEVMLQEEKNPLLWLPLSEDFTDKARFAGEQNIAHIMNVAMMYPIPEKSITQDGLYIGVDGCRAGWTAAVLDHGELRLNVYKSIASLVKEYPLFDAFLIDMPIGLRNSLNQVRPEIDARKELGVKASSVFPIPSRDAVYAKEEEEQKKVNLRVLDKSLSKQSLAIIPKIRELDEFLNDYPEYKNKILESHPEVNFTRLNGSVVLSKKKEESGLSERRHILSKYLDKRDLSGMYDKAKELGCGQDDLIDAICLAITGALHAHGQSETIPDQPETDEKGLLMQLTVPIKRY